MDNATYEKIRHRYRPESTRALFVGESRLKGVRFIFNGNSNLYRATRNAFETAFGQTYGDAHSFLTLTSPGVVYEDLLIRAL